MSGKLTCKMFICAAIAFGSIGYAGTAAADASEQEIALCERAIANGARGGGIPEPVLHAISLNETGRMRNGRLRPWPWAINREGRGHWFETREQALAFARKSVAEGRHSFDVGCFQINYRWHGQNFVSLESMFDPEGGAAYAAKFLSGQGQRSAGSYALICPGVGFSVMWHFWVNKGLVASGLIAKFGAAYWIATALALIAQVAMIGLLVWLHRQHFGKPEMPAAVPAE